MGEIAHQITLTRAGDPEVLVIEATPMPTPASEQIVVQMEAAGVAFGDTTIRQGRNPGKLPAVLGYDVVGRVAALGAGVDGFPIGQRVAALCMTGGYATHVVVGVDSVVRVPDELDAAAVSALTLNYLTAWQLLHRAAKVQPGQSILILGAAGGVGSALTELAALDRLRVLGTASQRRHEVLRARGVTVVDDQESVPEPVDATFDSIGGPSLARSRRATKKAGVVVSYGFSFTVDGGYSRAGGLGRTIAGLLRAKLTPGPRTISYRVGLKNNDPAQTREDLTRLIELLRTGVIDPLVETMPLAEAVGAHRRLEARQVVGKLVLVP